MTLLAPDQRNYYYLIEAARVGIHKPILAALYSVHQQPTLDDGERGLGIAPANRVRVDQVNTFRTQVQYAANTIRSITDSLTAQGWQSSQMWDANQARYSDRFVREIAEGYSPPASDTAAARLEPSNGNALLQAYLEDITYDYRADQLPQNLANLDRALLNFAERVPANYGRLDFQRQAMLEANRVWRKLDTKEAVLQSLGIAALNSAADESTLDQALTDFIRNISPFYSGYPHQREALIRLVQIWRQLDSREEAIEQLATTDLFPNETNVEIIDPALISFIQRVPNFYRGQGDQRFALTEAFRLWNGLASRSDAVTKLGVSPDYLSSNANNSQALATAAAQLDRELLSFLERVPQTYQETTTQREALIRLVQIWRRLEGRTSAVQSLLEDVRQMQRAARNAVESMPPPRPVVTPPRPARWTPSNIQLDASIIPNGNFNWAEATRGGTRMPPNQATVDAIVRIARMAQEARDRIGRPFHITSWYRSAAVNRQVGGASASRHIVGDAIDFYCDGLTGDQIYWALDPWWTGGLGRYTQFPRLSHLDARGYRARWRH
jgi:hypothetical protein